VSRKGDGVWFVNFAPLSDPALVPSTVATTMGIPVSGQGPVEQTLLAALRRQHSLIVLDNCEHVVAAAADLANALLLNCPQVSLPVTSREPLHIPGCVYLASDAAAW
jgi:predicted ATPase